MFLCRYDLKLQIEELTARLGQREQEIMKLELNCEDLRGGQQGKYSTHGCTYVRVVEYHHSYMLYVICPFSSFVVFSMGMKSKSKVLCYTSYCIIGQRLESQHLSEELNALNDQLRSNRSFYLLLL